METTQKCRVCGKNHLPSLIIDSGSHIVAEKCNREVYHAEAIWDGFNIEKAVHEFSVQVTERRVLRTLSDSKLESFARKVAYWYCSQNALKRYDYDVILYFAKRSLYAIRRAINDERIVFSLPEYIGTRSHEIRR